jgi:integrase
VDWDAKFLRVSRIVSQDADGNVILAEPKTSRSRRLVTLPDDTLSVLREWQQEASGEMMFPTRNGTLRSPHNINEAWVRLLVRAGLPHVKFHSLRHLHATLLLEAGVSPKVVSERLGHTSIGITLDLYSHVTAPLQQHAADTIGRAMSGLHKQ